MRTLAVIFGCTAIAVATGCNGGGTSSLPATRGTSGTTYVLAADALRAFSAGANGSATPLAQYAYPPAARPIGVASAPDGTVYLLTSAISDSTALTVSIYAPHATTLQQQLQITIAPGSVAKGIALVDDGIDIATLNDAYTYPYGPATQPSPIRALHYRDASAFTADAAGTLYVGHLDRANPAQSSIDVYAPRAAGTAAPTQTMPAQGLIGHIAVASDGTIYGASTTTQLDAGSVVFTVPASGTANRVVATYGNGTADPSLRVMGLSVNGDGLVYVGLSTSYDPAWSWQPALSRLDVFDRGAGAANGANPAPKLQVTGIAPVGEHLDAVALGT